MVRPPLMYSIYALSGAYIEYHFGLGVSRGIRIEFDGEFTPKMGWVTIQLSPVGGKKQSKPKREEHGSC